MAQLCYKPQSQATPPHTTASTVLVRTFRAVLLAVLSASLAGCMTALAIISPPRTKLEPLPDRYMRLSVDLVVNGQRHTIEHVWICTHEKGFNEGTGWMLHWRAPRRTYVVKAVAKDLVVFFRQPSSNYCLREGKVPYSADIGVIPDPSTVDNVIVHHAEHFPRSSALLGGSIERLSYAPKLSDPTRVERSLAARLVWSERQLVSSFVVITPESIWSRYPEWNSYFGAMQAMTVAPPPTSPHHPIGFPIQRVAPLTVKDIHERLHYSVQDIEGTIRFDFSRTPEHVRIFRIDTRDFRRSILFCYAERCVTLKRSFSEIYDPVTRNIIGVGHSLPLETWFH